MSAVATLDLAQWRPTLTDDEREAAARTIEDGGVIRLPRLPFLLSERERRFLSPEWSDGRAKNISLDGTRLKGATGTAEDQAALAAMIARFAAGAALLVTTLFPRYAPYVKRARTSYRPLPAVGRNVSWRKDDSRLHVDAFPSNPMQGLRLLRVFSNVNPHGEPRRWRIGEPFADFAGRHVSAIGPQWPGKAVLLNALHVTKRPRSQYDHYMLQLHDRAKADLRWQREVPQVVHEFSAGSTWVVFSDQVLHAVTGGQFMLEQTFTLRPEHLKDASTSPLAVLEQMTGRRLLPH